MVQWNSLLIAFLAVFAVSSLCRWFLTQTNVRHLTRHGQEVPPVFRGDIDEGTLSRMNAYTVESSHFNALEHLFDDMITIVILLSGFLPWLSGRILTGNYHFITSGLIFLGILAFMSGTLGIPFNLYRTFVIEKKHGFSTITLTVWITDLIKSFLLTAILMGFLLGAFLTLLHYAPRTWWFWTWIVFSAFQALMVWLYPILIAPLFNKFEPVKNESLKDALVSLMAQAGLHTEGVYQVDAGKRSKHTNAYFTGLGKTKRIILYDTLLASHTVEEILAILAHEIGHWKRKHIAKQLVFMEVVSLGLLYLTYRLIDWPLLYHTFGFQEPVPYIGLLLLAALFGPFGFFLTPLGAALMRKFEREADDFCVRLTGTSQAMITALKRLARDNLANLHPHPLFAWFYYSHPPLTERITRLQDIERASQGHGVCWGS